MYIFKRLPFIAVSVLLLGLASCKKDKTTPPAVTTPATASPVKIDMYAAGISFHDTVSRALYIDIAKIGTQSTTAYTWQFDTGSGGLVVDASGILPASMITTSGFTFTGDSTVVNGITVTKQPGTSSYVGATIYGNLAYADIVVGDAGSGNVTIKRVPFLLYYKAVNLIDPSDKIEPHEFDIFGSSNLYDLTFPNGVQLTTPFAYYTPGTGLTNGFKMAAVPTTSFSTDYSLAKVSGALSVGLTSADLSSSSGFVFHTLALTRSQGYFPVVPGTVTYGSKSYSTNYIAFDSGTSFENALDDASVTGRSTLASNTSVTIATTAGFSNTYIASTKDAYLTIVENPSLKDAFGVTLLGIQFFYNHQFLLDIPNHRLGLK